MKLTRCPVCHSNIHLDQLIADDSGRQLLGLFAKMNYKLGGVLVAYLALFRPAKQDLSNNKALTLTKEVLELTQNHSVLAEALEQTVNSLHQGRVNGQNRQLTNHNYLKKVLLAKIGQVNEQLKQDSHSSIEYKNVVSINKDEEIERWKEQMNRYGYNASAVKPTDKED